jgi:hypothetical protein
MGQVMTRLIRDREIRAVSIVDDDDEARAGYTLPLEDLQIQPVQEKGPLPPLEEFWKAMRGRSDAVLCDHHLKKGNYADFNGAEAVATWFEMGFPAVLCTKWEKAQIDEIRPYRSRIPALIQPDQLAIDPEILVKALDECILELSGEHTPERRPWSAQVYVVDVETEGAAPFFYVELPGSQIEDVIRLRKRDVPPEIRERLVPEFRCHAMVNLGAEASDEVYFEGWRL